MRAVLIEDLSYPLNDELVIDGDNFHHLKNVLRIKEGKELLLLNGKGLKALTEVIEIQKKLINYLLSEKFFNRNELNPEDFEQKFKDIINLITMNAPIKIIYKNKNEAEIILMFNEIINEINETNEQLKQIESGED